MAVQNEVSQLSVTQSPGRTLTQQVGTQYLTPRLNRFLDKKTKKLVGYSYYEGWSKALPRT